MKNKYKINIDRENISSAEIAKGMNFGNVIKGSSSSALKPNLLKNKWFIATISTVITASIIIAVIITTGSDETKPETNSISEPSVLHPDNENSLNNKSIQPPLKENQIPFSTYNVNGKSGGKIYHPSGTSIIIPAKTFVNENGEIINDDIQIKYREFHDPVDFFLYGIPMDYDSAGVNYNFASAGMMEIIALSNGQEVFISDDKEIEIEMTSLRKGNQYNVYYFDTLQGIWDFRGKDKVSIQMEKEKNLPTDSDSISIYSELPENEIVEKAKNDYENNIKKIEKDKKQLEKEKPIKPAIGANDSYYFDITMDPKEFPELSMYKNVEFEVQKGTSGFDESVYKTSWDKMEIKNSQKQGFYKVVLSNSSKRMEFLARPVFSGKNLEEAQVLYEKKLNEYETKLAVKQEEEKRLQLEYEARVKEYEKEVLKQKLEYEKYQMEASRRNKNMQTSETIKRSFKIDRLGTWNCDYPYYPQNAERVFASFVSNEGRSINCEEVLVANLDRNVINPFRGNKVLGIEPNTNTIIWILSGNGEIYIPVQQPFVRNTSLEKSVRIEVKEFSGNADELKKVLGV